jgi:hypothetical protein
LTICFGSGGKEEFGFVTCFVSSAGSIVPEGRSSDVRFVRRNVAWLAGCLPERRAAEYRLMIIWNELAICRRLPVTYQHARKNAGHEGPAADGSGCRMVRFAETAGEKEPRSFRVKFVVASCTRQTPGALSMGPVHISVGTELNLFLYFS